MDVIHSVAALRERLQRVPGVLVTHVGLLDPVGGNKQIEFSLQGADQRELERLTLSAMERLRSIPGLVDLDTSVRANKPTLAVKVNSESAADLGLGTAQLGAPLRILVAGQTVGNWRAPDDQTYDVNVRLAPERVRRLPRTETDRPARGPSGGDPLMSLKAFHVAFIFLSAALSAALSTRTSS